VAQQVAEQVILLAEQVAHLVCLDQTSQLQL
jgi:hypothetical protein